MGLLVVGYNVVFGTSLFTIMCFALYYMLTGRGSRMGDIQWLLEGKSGQLWFAIIEDVLVASQEYHPTCGVEWESD